MYRFIIADDEAIIRQGILHLLDYEALGFTACAEAATGDQTYRLLMELKPDVALVDIRMPGLSGLEAVKQARKDGYSGKVIIISSYSDFHYAQEAIRSGVDNYITKPIDEDELQQIFLEIKADLDRGSGQDSKPSLEAILSGNAQVPLPESCQVLVWTDFALDSVCQELHIPALSREEYEYGIVEGKHTILLKGKDAIRKLRDVSFGSSSRLLAPYFCCVSDPTSPALLKESFQSTKALLDRRFFCTPSQHLLFAQDGAARPDNRPRITSQLMEEFTQRLLSYIQTFNRKLTDAALAELRTVLCSGSDSPEQIRLFLTDLYLQIKESMNSRYPAGTISFYSNSSIIRHISQANYLDDILDFMSSRFDMIMSSTGTSTRDSVLDDVLHYIHHNYATNITLEGIAPLFGYNHSYLGKIFRKKLGCSFNSYVDQVRIEKAKELLLQDDTKVYAISEKVGYKNVDYFHVKFRKYVNQSPAEFRKANRQV